MDEKEKADLNEYLKSMGSTKTVDELEAIRKRAVRTMEEWACQTAESQKALPETVLDMRLICRYSLLMALSGMAPVSHAWNAMDMAIESAYNLGKAEAKA